MSTDQDFLRALRESASIDVPEQGAKARLAAAISAGGTAAAASTSVVASAGAKWLLGALLGVTLGAGALVATNAGNPSSPPTVVETPGAAPVVAEPLPAQASDRVAPSVGKAASPVNHAGAPVCSAVRLRDVEPTVCSKPGRHVQFDLRNTCGTETLDVFWVDFECHESFVGRLAPGEHLVHSTFDTHPWRVRDHETHRLVKEFVTEVLPGAPAVDDDAGTIVLPDLVATESSRAADVPPTVCSRNGNRASSLRVRNERASGVVLFWVDRDCHERLYKRLAPGESVAQATFDGHPWRVRDMASGSLLIDFVPDPNFLDTTVYMTLP